MTRHKLISHLTSTNLISPSSAVDIAAEFEHKHIPRHELLLGEGRICDEYLYLETGYMRAFANDTNGNEITTSFYQPGQIIFEISSLFARTRSKENIQALTDCEGWYISYQQLNHLFHALPEFREFGRSVLVKGVAALKDRMLATITETAEERYAALLASSPEIFQHAPLKNIATYLGITDTSLSRIRKEFSKK